MSLRKIRDNSKTGWQLYINGSINMQLDKNNKDYKFNFFNKPVAHRNVKIINITFAMLVTISAIFGVSQIVQRHDGVKVPILNNSSQFKSDENKILSNLEEIDFDKNPEKMKRAIWKKFSVPVHYIYINSDTAEFGFTYKGEDYTAVVGQDKEGNSVYLPNKKQYLTSN